MTYARISNRIPNVEAPPNGKAFIDVAAGASLVTGPVNRVAVIFGETLYSVVLQPGKVWPVHLRTAYMRAYFWLKENNFPLQADGSCTVMSIAGIYAGDLALLSPVRPDFTTTDDFVVDMDQYGIGISIGYNVVSYYGAESAIVKNGLVECLDYGKNNAGQFVTL